MANIKLFFCGANEAEQQEKQLQAFTNDKGLLFISIENGKGNLEVSGIQFTALDKSTAIRLSRELRKQIALMK